MTIHLQPIQTEAERMRFEAAVGVIYGWLVAYSQDSTEVANRQNLIAL